MATMKKEDSQDPYIYTGTTKVATRRSRGAMNLQGN